jgi:hypothetical protein
MIEQMMLAFDGRARGMLSQQNLSVFHARIAGKDLSSFVKGGRRGTLPSLT